MSLRREFVELACLDGANMQALCERFGISRPTGYKWLRRYQAEGLSGLADRSRRPKVSPARTSEALERAALVIRDEHPAWGARKIRRVLEDRFPKDRGHEATSLPSPSTLTEILRRNARLDPAECARHRPHRRFEHANPNDLWQMDFKGHFGLASGHRCHPLTLLDDHSRFCLVLSACADERAGTVQQRLIECFRKHGMPVRILCDNGPPWAGAGARSSHTTLSAWLIRLGVSVYHGRAWHPETQGKEERFHRTLLDELVRPVMGLSVRWNAGASDGKPGAASSQSGKVTHVPDYLCAQAHFDDWRRKYNEMRPHEAIGMQTPASRYAPSLVSYPEKLVPVEYAAQAGQIVRRVHPSGEISFENRRYFVGSAFAGQPVALRPTDQDGTLFVYFCHQRIGSIDLRHTTKPNNNHGSNQNQCVNHVSEHV